MNVAQSAVVLTADASAFVLALVFVCSGVSKLLAPGVVAHAFRQLRLPHPVASLPGVIVLSTAEFLVGAALAFASGPVGMLPRVAALGLIVVFLVVVAREMRSGGEASCACFGVAAGRRTTMWTLARTIFLLALAATSLTRDGVERPSVLVLVDPWAAVVVALVLVLLALVELGNRERSARIEAMVELAALRMQPGTGAGTPIVVDPGAGVPEDRVLDVEIVSVRGETRRLRDLLLGRPVLLVFAKTSCGSCADVVRDVVSWHANVNDAIDLYVLTSSPPDEVKQRFGSGYQRAWYGAANTRRVFGITVMPSAVLLAANGTVPLRPALGQEDIMGLLLGLSRTAGTIDRRRS